MPEAFAGLEEGFAKDERALERLAVAFERIATVAEKWYERVYPVKPVPQDAIVTRVPTDEDRLRANLHGPEKTLSKWLEPPAEWAGPREKEFLKSGPRPKRAAKTQKDGSTAPPEGDPGTD